METHAGSFVSHLLTESLPNLLEVASEPEYMKEFYNNVRTRIETDGLPYVIVHEGQVGWTIDEELKRVADAHPDKYNYAGALLASQVLGLGSKAALSVGKPGVALGLNVASKAVGTLAKTTHGSQGNPTQTVTQYRKAFRPKSGENSTAMRKRMEARIPALLAAGKLKEG